MRCEAIRRCWSGRSTMPSDAEMGRCTPSEDAARWLAEHAPEILRWPSADDAAFRHVQATADVWAGRVAAAVELAELAAQFAGENQADRDAAYCGGLLYYADDWLKSDAMASSDASPDLRKLKLDGGAPRLAISALLDKPAAAHKAPSLAPNTAEAAERWRQDIAGPADWLPDLANSASPGWLPWRKASPKPWKMKNSPRWRNLPRGRDTKSTTP